jgi:hypothetical protein
MTMMMETETQMVVVRVGVVEAAFFEQAVG